VSEVPFNFTGLITPRLVTELLGQQLVPCVGEPVDVVEEQQFSGYADVISRVRLTYGSGVSVFPTTLIVKVFGPRWYVGSGLPELRFYREMAPLMPGRLAPQLFGFRDVPGRQLVILLLEDLNCDYMQATLPLADDWLCPLVDILASLHSNWWEHPRLDHPEFLVSEEGVTQMPQALDAAGIEFHMQRARQALQRFQGKHMGELSLEEHTLLQAMCENWARLFAQRVTAGQALTLLHGDLHVMGNVFLSRRGAPGGVKFIDWTQAKRGLGPHDLMYLLLSIETPDRASRDTALLRRYHSALVQNGIRNYSWAQCLWDYRFSLLTNLWQAIFQESVHWFRTTLDIVRIWKSDELLLSPAIPFEESS